MVHYVNGMAANEVESDGFWQKAEASQGIQACAELRRLDDGQVAIRNSRYPKGPALILTTDETRALIDGVKRGEFDHLVA